MEIKEPDVVFPKALHAQEPAGKSLENKPLPHCAVREGILEGAWPLLSDLMQCHLFKFKAELGQAALLGRGGRLETGGGGGDLSPWPGITATAVWAAPRPSWE